MGNKLFRYSQTQTILSSPPVAKKLCRFSETLTVFEPFPILSLPDEILLEIIIRVDLDALPSIPFVCRRFSNLVNYADFLRPRFLPTLHVLLFSNNSFLMSASLALNNSKWSPSIRRSLPNPHMNARLVSLGRCIYVLCFKSTMRYDTWTKTAVSVSPSIIPAKKYATAVVNGKIYVADGFNTPVQEYDPAADEWRVVSYVPTPDSELGAGAGGVFYILAHKPAGLMDGYNVSAGNWARGITAPVPAAAGVVISACGTPAGHVYIIVGNEFLGDETELSFWRWEGKGVEWTRLEAPPVPERKGLVRKAVRFSCVAAGDERVVAIVNISPRGVGGWIGRDVLMYNVIDGIWSRGPELPIDFYSEPALAFTEY